MVPEGWASVGGWSQRAVVADTRDGEHVGGQHRGADGRHSGLGRDARQRRLSTVHQLSRHPQTTTEDHRGEQHRTRVEPAAGSHGVVSVSVCALM